MDTRALLLMPCRKQSWSYYCEKLCLEFSGSGKFLNRARTKYFLSLHDSKTGFDMDLNEYKDILLQYVIATRSYVIDTFTRMALSCPHCEVSECEFYDMVTQFLLLLQFAELRINTLNTTVECLPQEEDGPIIVEVDDDGLPNNLPQAFEILQQAAVAHEAFLEEDQVAAENLILPENVKQVAPGNIYFHQPEYDAPQEPVEENLPMPEYDDNENEISAFNWDNIEGPIPFFSSNVSDYSDTTDNSDDDESSS